MSGRDAFEEEMEFLRRLKPEDEERLIAGTATEPGELAELAAFSRALSAMATAESAPPSDAFIAQLAETARAGGATVEVAPETNGHPVRAPRRRPRRRLALVARVAVAVACLPLLFAGLAFAGVSLPGPADDAFETLGIELPNQTSDAPEDGQGGDEGDTGSPDDPGAQGRENAAEKRGHGKDKSNPAREQGRGVGEQGQGRGLGQRGVAPGQGKSNAGGQGGNHPVGKPDSAPDGPPAEPPGKPDSSPGNSGNAGGAANGNAGGGNAGGNGNGNGPK